METTLVLLKPDCMNKKHAGEVIGRFENAGLELVGCKMMQLTSAILREHYSHIADKPFFPEVEGFMSSRTVVALALRGEGAIGMVRDLAGPTNSKEAPEGSIRGDLGEDVMHNIVHASDGADTAAAELKRFFNTGEVFV